jgi:hypothetical protein
VGVMTLLRKQVVPAHNCLCLRSLCKNKETRKRMGYFVCVNSNLKPTLVSHVFSFFFFSFFFPFLFAFPHSNFLISNNMPKAARLKSKAKKLDTPLRQRKFAVSEKEVLEKLVVNGEEISVG